MKITEGQKCKALKQPSDDYGNKTPAYLPALVSMCGIVGTLEAENFSLSLLKGTDPQENITFNLRLWKKLPKLSDSTGIMDV